MKGDFSRLSFNPDHGFTRVTHQQGTLVIDSDLNEQQAINLHLLRTLAEDLIGPHGGTHGSFQVTADPAIYRNFTIAPGRYYVEGCPCLNPRPSGYRSYKEMPGQPWYPDPEALANGTDYLVYLEVWERHLSAAEFDRARDPAAADAVREVALNGPATASRTQLVWQARVLPVAAAAFEGDGGAGNWRRLLPPSSRGRLKAKAAEPPVAGGPPCEVSPRARFRGDSDQLYRVEIRRGGHANEGPGDATFVWSRENGSVFCAIDVIAGPKVRLATGWRDARFAIAPGDIVEIAGPLQSLKGSDAPLLRVMDYDPDSATVTLSDTPDVNTDDPRAPAILRRWDHGNLRGPVEDRPKLADDNALQLVEGRWLTLEDGIQVMFEREMGFPRLAGTRKIAKADGVDAFGRAAAEGAAAPLNGDFIEKDGVPAGRFGTVYRQGDYWQIPSRVVLADVLGPRGDDEARTPLAQPPHGVERFYAPLALISVAGDGAVQVTSDLRREFAPLAGT